MIDSWHRFLLNFQPNTNAPLFSVYNPYVTNLCQFAYLFVTGPNSNTFLQGLSTLDINQLSPTQAGFGAFTNNKGRIISTCQIIPTNEQDYLLLLPQDQIDTIKSTLERYVFRSNVKIRYPETPLITIEYSNKPNLGSGTTPKQPLQITQTSHTTVIKQIHDPERYLVISPNQTKMEEQWRQLAETRTIINENQWNAIQIQLKLTHINQNLQELYLPQMIQLDKTNGLSLNKGCFIGQEIIARTSHLGTLKRQLIKAHCDPSCEQNTPITTESGDKIGKICLISTATRPSCCLAVIHRNGLNKPLCANNKPLLIQEG